MTNTIQWLAPAVALVGAMTGTALAARGASASYRRLVDEYRERLRRELPATPAGGTKLAADASGVVLTIPPEEPPGDTAGEPSGSDRRVTNTHYEIHVHQDALEQQRAEREEQTFTVLLADYYAHGLAQAQRSSVVSLAASIVGGIILMAGVSLAIWRSETTGQLYAAMATSVSGLVTGTIAVLFHRQGRLALQHMEGQAQHLRLDMRTERGFRQAVRLVDHVDDKALRSRLQAALILKFSDAQLPDLSDAAPSPQVASQRAASG
ncbi:TRADD-N-associated membrane domain-containing protein [Kitasatospora paranensis]|uniref:Cyanobacterial TRADD-N associated 2 transmembrane domain-containing protein n=1 Tax=Kitasatospora paranensis TaxID=258053 RepID=A0ABW2G7S4_9ACTN